MPRTGCIEGPDGSRFPDRVAVGMVARMYPPDLVDQVVAAAGRTEQRRRLLPARIVVYSVLGLALFRDAPYEDAMRLVADGLGWAVDCADTPAIPTKAAFARARARLGPRPIELLFHATATPVSTAGSVGSWHRGRRLACLDATRLDVGDSKVNTSVFGRSAHKKRGLLGVPQVRIVGLAECGTGILLDAAIGGRDDLPSRLAEVLVGSMGPEMLILADRPFSDFGLWTRAIASGADLVWRADAHQPLAVAQTLSDGSYLARLCGPSRDRSPGVGGVAVRVVEFSIDGRAASIYRLLTTILDPKEAPALELAALYRLRWKIRDALAMLESRGSQTPIALRSKTPDGVIQEAYGHLCVHNAVRWLLNSSGPARRPELEHRTLACAIRPRGMVAAEKSAIEAPGMPGSSEDPSEPMVPDSPLTPVLGTVPLAALEARRSGVTS